MIEKSIIKGRHIEELETWLSTREAARRLGVSRQHAINLSRDSRSPVRAIHVGKSGEGERGVWIFDPASVRTFHLEKQDEAERAKREERDALIRRANETHEVGA